MRLHTLCIGGNAHAGIVNRPARIHDVGRKQACGGQESAKGSQLMQMCFHDEIGVSESLRVGAE
jgi:hypothetical protein